jgi:hypothetical protein
MEAHHKELEDLPANRRFAALTRMAKDYIDPHTGEIREDLKLLAKDRPVYMLVTPGVLKGLKQNKGWSRLLYLAYQQGKPKNKVVALKPEVHARLMATKTGSVSEHLTRLMDMRDGLFNLEKPLEAFSLN